MKREFLQLAHQHVEGKQGIAGWYMSEKLDGMRCFWDGGISTGIPKLLVPWANNEKDERYKEPPIATGLWSRYGNVIHAPEEFLQDLPNMPLDGELFIGRGMRQQLMATVKDIVPGSGWGFVKLYCFDVPSYQTVFADGEIKNTHFKKVFKDIMTWIHEKNVIKYLDYYPKAETGFRSTVFILNKYVKGPAIAHKQIELPYSTDEAIIIMKEYLGEITDLKGEGLILRHPHMPYACERSHYGLKVKKYDDAEATVIGYTTGRETDKGSKLLGMMGALILDYEGKTFKLSGFEEPERMLVGISKGQSARDWAIKHPEEEVPEWIHAVKFLRGARVTFKYRDFTNDGIPTEASYMRRDERW